MPYVQSRPPADLSAQLDDQRAGLGTLLGRDFSGASALEMIAACRARMAEADVTVFETALLRDFVEQLSDGTKSPH